MKVETLKDVLNWTITFHDDLAGCMRHCSVHNKDPRSKLLLDFFAKHESKLSGVIKRFTETARPNVLNTWCVEYLDKHPIIHSKACDAPLSEMTSVQIMVFMTERHQKVITMFQDLNARADIPESQDLLDVIHSLEEHEAKLMTQAANRLEDL